MEMQMVLLLSLLGFLWQSSAAQDITSHNYQQTHCANYGDVGSPFPNSYSGAYYDNGLWKKRGTGVRFSRADSLVYSIQLSLYKCSARCYHSPRCVSFNYQELTETCELLNTAPIPSDNSDMVNDQTWNYYTLIHPNPPRDRSTLCPVGSVLVPYDYPVFMKYDPTVEGYVCTDNAWILGQYSQGKTDCRMTLHYKIDFPGYDSDYKNVRKPYDVAMRNCLAKSCSGVVCLTNLDVCWLKLRTPTEVGAAPVRKDICNYWEAVCT